MKKIVLSDYTSSSYDLHCGNISLGAAPFSMMTCEVPPGAKSRIHNHAEREIFLFLNGSGRVRSQGDEVQITGGEAIEMAPFAEHEICNSSTTHTLQFLSLYWMGNPSDSLQRAENRRPLLVFSTPPTPNGDLHLGHLSGPYLAGDIIRRANLQRGRPSLHVTGRDDNQTYVVNKARADGITPFEVCETYASMIRATLERARIPLNGFISPDRGGAYSTFVQSVIKRLYDDGHIFAKKAPALFGEDGQYLHEAYVRGMCPHCGSESDGNACEACGHPNQCVDLLDPVDKRTGGGVRVVEVERLYFRFSAFAKQLSVLIKQCQLPARVFSLAQRMLDDGLPDICVSHPSSWGMPVGIAGYESHVLYVWFEMAAGYLFGAAQALDPGVSDPWEAAPRAFSRDYEIIHAYGFDNAYYHTLLFPAVYFALDIGIVPPKVHIVNELLDLEGQKFSTSRNHLIWGRDLLAQVPTDAVRFGLSLARPQGIRTDFSLHDFVSQANDFFCDTLRPWIDEVANVSELVGKTVPEPGAWLADQRAYYGRIQHFFEVMERTLSVNEFAPHEAASEMRNFARDSLRFAKGQVALGSVSNGHGSDYLRTAVALSVLGLRAFSIMIEPITPSVASEMRGAIGVSESTSEAMFFLPAGHPIDWERFPSFLPVSAVARLDTESQP